MTGPETAMEPPDDRPEPLWPPPRPRGERRLVVVVLVVLVALLVSAIALHLAGGAPVHGR